MKILVNHKNLSEVISCYGVMTLATCLDSPVSRCRFTRSKTRFCQDKVIRNRVFEFDHPDAAGLLARIAALEIGGTDDSVVLREHQQEVITLDWWSSSNFVGDKGNFSKIDKREFVTLHHDAFKALVTTEENLFALSMETDEANYLANFSQAKKNYVDSGGVYESDDPIFAREFLLICGLQNFDFMSQLVNEDNVVYAIPTTWTNLGGFAAALSGKVGEKCETTVKSFGKDGLVLASATEFVEVNFPAATVGLN